MTYYVTFFTHSGAIKFSRKCGKLGLKNESGPVPRKLSSNCGIGVKLDFEGNIEELYDEEIEKIFKLEGDQFTLIADYDL